MKKKIILLLTLVLISAESFGYGDGRYNIGPDDRLTIRDEDDIPYNDMPYVVIGKLINHVTNRICTATLIDTDIILTASRCVSYGRDRNADPKHYMFYPRWRYNQFHPYSYSHASGIHSIVTVNGDRTKPGYADVALLRLESPLGSLPEYGYAQIEDFQTLNNFSYIERLRNNGIMLSAHSNFRGYGMYASAHLGCSIKFFDGVSFGHDCDFDEGGFGGPVFSMETKKIVGIASGISALNATVKYNYAINLSTLHQVLPLLKSNLSPRSQMVVTFCNTQDAPSHPVKMGIAYKELGKWRSSGWHNIQYGKCETFRMDPSVKDVYAYTSSTDKNNREIILNKGRGKKFCTSKEGRNFARSGSSVRRCLLNRKMFTRYSMEYNKVNWVNLKN